MKHIFKKFGVVLVFLLTACELGEDLQNPNQISPDGADVNLVMNSVQLSFSDFFSSAQRSVNPLVRMEAMTGGYRYQTANTPEGVNGLWSLAYEDILINADLVIELASVNNQTTHIAAAKIMKAYVYLTLVDIFGDIPQSEALRASEGLFNPVADPGADVYAHAITLLGEARTELEKTGAEVGPAFSNDQFYAGDRVKWTALANTLELKAWLNVSMIAARKTEADARIATLLTSDLVDTEAENFTYKYGTATVPVSRHPVYRQYYAPTAGQAGGYIANYFLNELFNGNGVEDPRWRYYFYRQVGSIVKALDVDPKSLGCSPGAIPDHYNAAGTVFCSFEPGFYGRDHGDGSGIPPDGPVITAVGVYPAGGRIDNTATSNANYFASTKEGDGANGAGIEPIWMSWYTDFLRAEILARANNAAAAKTAMDAGITKSIAQIRSFATSKNQTTTREPSTTAYMTAVTDKYNAATNKLDVIAREFYVSLWGNGIEAYNSYRRTSSPRNMQPTLQLNPGPFYRSYVYPANYVNLNENGTQKDFNATNKVFWDTNPDNLN